MNRRSMLIFMLLSTIMFTVLPAAAQDEDSTPPSCTAQEIADSAANARQLSEQISAAAAISGDAKTADELSTGLIAWGNTYQSYLDEIYPSFPGCIEGIFISDVLGLMLNEQMTLSSMALMNVEQIAAGDTDEDITAVLNDLALRSGEVLQTNASSFTGMMSQLNAGNSFPSWLPACTDEQNAFIPRLEALETTYAEQIDKLQAYLNDGTLTKDTYVTMANLVNDLTADLQKGSAGCADLYPRTVGNIFLFNDTIAALNVGLALTYRAESDDAEALTALRDAYNERLASYITTEE